jgi:hypothetical protein
VVASDPLPVGLEIWNHDALQHEQLHQQIVGEICKVRRNEKSFTKCDRLDSVWLG